MALHRDVKKYYVYRALLKRFALPILVLYGLDQGLSLSELAVIAAAGKIISFVLELPSGVVADKIGHRKTLVFSMLGQGLSMALYLGGSFWWMFAGAVAYMGFGSFMTGTSEAFFFERLQQLGLTKKHAKLSGAGKGFATAVSVISMLLAGVFYEIAWWLPFVVGVTQFVLAAYVVSTIGPTKDEVSVEDVEQEKTHTIYHLKESWKEIKSKPDILWFIVASGLVIGPLYAVGDFQQAVMDDVGITASLIGAVYAAKRLLSVFVQASTHKFMNFFTPGQFVSISALFCLLHLFGMGIIENPWWLVGPLIIGSLAWVGLDIAINDYINQSSDTRSRATLLSTRNFIQAIVGLVTVVIYGFVTRTSTAAEGYFVLGVILTILLIVPLWKLNRKYEQLNV